MAHSDIILFMGKLSKKNIFLILTTLTLSSCGLETNVNSALKLPAGPLKIQGCMVQVASNYNVQAEEEDGTCSFKGCMLFSDELKNSYTDYRAKYPASSLESTCPAPVSEVHNQNTKPHVGIIWVIDNSFSMEAEINNIMNNFNSFINEFLNTGLEFTMGITTTDSKHVSRSLSQLTSETARINRGQFIQNFKSLVDVGIDGSGFEEGYKGSYDFLQAYAGQLLRPSSYLSIIYVSDERDQSDHSPLYYLDHAASYVGGQHKVRMHAILDLDDSGGEDSSKGARYLENVYRTKGIKGDVDGNFSSILKQIGSNLTSLKHQFNLVKIPHLPTLEVFVNGKKISNWTYNNSENAILIDPTPEYGSEILINYTPIN